MNITLFKALKQVSWNFNNGYSLKQIIRRWPRFGAACAAGLLIVGGSFYVFAQSDTNQYNVQVVHVFPGKISSDSGWTNIETLRNQNLDQFALYQEFNQINSAYFELEEVSISQVIENRTEAEAATENEETEGVAIELSPTNSASTTTTTPSATSTSEDTASASGTENAPTSEIEDSPGTEPAEPVFELVPDTETLPVTETVVTTSTEPTIDSESGTTTVLKRATAQLAFMFETVRDFLPFATESTTTPTVLDSAGFESGTTSESESAVVNDVEIISSSSTEPVDVPSQAPTTTETLAGATSTPFEPVAEAPEEDSVATTTEAVTATAPTTTPQTLPSTATSSAGASSTEAEGASTTPIIADECGDECADYRLEMSDFWLPLFDDGSLLDGLQLKLSMGGKMKETRDTSQWLTSRFSLDDGETWSQGGEILISEEVSNSTNGGYFVLALPEITDPEILKQLRVELIYEEDPRALEGLYIDSVWLELFTLSGPELDLSFDPLNFDTGYENVPLSGDRLTLPDGKRIEFTHTDDNTDETLIIKTDSVTYAGVSKIEAYVSVTNTSNNDDAFALQTYFPRGVGEVESVSVWNQNRPQKAVIPEYRPFVYHCEGGWEVVDGEVPDSIETLSQQFAPADILDAMEEQTATSTVESEIATTSPVGNANVSTTSSEREAVSTTTEAEREATEPIPVPVEAFEREAATSTATTTALKTPNKETFLQATIDAATEATEQATTSNASGTTTEVSSLFYSCRDTSVVQACDTITGDNTECRIENVKVREHEVTKYAGGWEPADAANGIRPDDRNLLQRFGDFIGLGVDPKEVPAQFEVRNHTEDRFTIAPNETRYFKLEITFPAFSNGEFWVEAIGQSEYGLLDPFWSSEWQYRIPIRIDNSQGTEPLSQQQIFFELDNTLTDFWSNVAEDGSDIRFIWERTVNNLFPEDGVVFDNTYDLNWSNRITLTVPASSIGSDLVDFPVHVDLSTLGADFWANVQSDGRDIRVTRSNGSTEVPVDLVWINSTEQTGQMYFKAPTLSASDATDFHIYFGNSAASAPAETDTYGSQNVWTNGYAAVYHFQAEGQAGRDNVGEYTDSTAFGFDAEDDTLAASTTGFLGDGVEFLLSNSVVGNDSSDHINIPYQVADGQPEMTFSIWYFSTTSGGIDHTLLSGMRSTSTGDYNDQDNEWIAWLPSNTTMQQFENGNSHATQGIPAVDSNGWAQYVFTRSVANNEFTYYVDGTGVGTSTETNTVQAVDVSLNGLNIGMEQDDPDIEDTLGADDTLDGFVDEVRFAREIRSHAWVVAEYETQANPTNFYSTSTDAITADPGSDAWYSTSWNGRQLLTIPPDEVQADQTDFPVYVDLSILDDAFFAGVASDGRDIRVTTKAGTELPIEIVRVDTGSETGEIHFKADLSSSQNNEFYIYYDNPDAIAYDDNATYGAHNVWTNDFVAVYHFDDSVAGTGNTDVYLDSTGNEYHGDDENTSDDTTGIVGRGAEFGDSIGDHVDLPDEVLDGLTDMSVSGFYLVQDSASATDRMIMSGANASQADEFMIWLDRDGGATPNSDDIFFENTNSAEEFNLDFEAVWADGLWDHFFFVADDAADTVEFFFNGVADGANPQSRTIDELQVDNGGFVFGQNQSSVGSFTTANQFVGLLDEIRIASTTRSTGWANTAYKNQAENATFFSTSSAEVLQEVEFVELDHWVQYFSSTTEEADIWVQVEEVPAGDTAIIWLYYGASGATSASDEFATFTYDEMQDLYYIVDDDVSSVSVQSLIDNNQVSFNGLGTTTLNRGESTSTTAVDENTVIRALGPISGTVSGGTAITQDSTDTIAPISFATTTHALPTNRAVNTFYAFSPFGSTTVDVHEAAVGGSPDATFIVATNTAGSVTFDITDSGNIADDGNGALVESTLPIVLTHKSSTPGDGYVVYPPTTRDIFGVYSQNTHVSAVESSATPTVFCSNGSTGGITVTQGDKENDAICDTGSDAEGAGPAVRYTGSTIPITAVQQADADGNETTAFWPQMEFGTRYALTNDAAYVAVVCSPRFGDVDLAVLDSSGEEITTSSCSPNTTDPGKAFLGSADGDTLAFTAGHQVVSTNNVPFYIYFEDISIQNAGAGGNTGDEKNVIGTVQARKFGADQFSFTFGAQETINDAEYNQNSFLWFEYSDEQTPTSTWPISDSNVAEGESITGAGALQDGDRIRLRMNIEANTATGTVDSAAFRLEYGTAATDQCSVVTETNWFEVGQPGSTTAAFSGYNITTIQDGSVLSSTTLASSTVFGTYEERNLSNLIQNEIGIGEFAEFDWVLEATNVDINTNYCFRMTRSGGVALNTYTAYPQLETVGPPGTPTLLVFFDNERSTNTTPILEFVATDIAGDDINYQVQVATTVDFVSPQIDRNSNDDFLQFENIIDNDDKAPFTSGDQVRFISQTTLATGTTYWWRVRADDPNGSATTSDWSSPYSFTLEDPTVVTVSEWYQTTGDQFSTNALVNMSTTSDEVALTASPATMTTNEIDFDGATFGNAWGAVSWSDTVTSGTSSVQVEFNNNGTWALIPDSEIPFNSVGATNSPISLSDLDTSTYNEIRLVATFEGTSVSLQEWSVTWGLRVDTPTLGDPFDNEKFAGLSPTFDFVTTDPQGDDLEYELSISTDFNFITSSSTFNSSTSVGFTNASNGGDTNPYTSGDTINYSVQAPLTDNTTYWWRVRAKDPEGDDSWSPWSAPDSFTASTSVTVSTWFQTTQAQFAGGEFDGAITSGDSVTATSEIGEFGSTTVQNGSSTVISLQRTYIDPIIKVSVRYERDTATQRTPRIIAKNTDSFEVLLDNFDSSVTGSTTIDFIVIEAGDYTLEGGERILAGTVEEVTAVDGQGLSNDPGGSTVTFSPAFSGAPLVLAQLSTYNDSDYAVASVYSGNDKDNAPTDSEARFFINKIYHDPEVHAAEDIDYIAIETGHGTNNGVEYDVAVSPATISEPADADNPTNTVSFTSSFSTAPETAVVQQLTQFGGDGGFMIRDTNTDPSTTAIELAIDEDGNGSTAGNRPHGGEESGGVIAFTATSGILARESGGADLSATYASEPVIFSDGTGPKFANFSFDDTTGGTSDVIYQLQHEVSEGVWAVIPNSALANNETGTSVSPIDLTGLDINVYDTIRVFATLTCDGATCPFINDLQVEWSEGFSMSGTIAEYDRTTPVTTGQVTFAVNSGASSTPASINGDGTWTLNNVTAFEGDHITVWVTNPATDADRAVAAFVYDGLGDITGVELFEEHLSISADEKGTTTNALLALRDNTYDQDIFYNVDGLNNLDLNPGGSSSQANIYIGEDNVYLPSTSTPVTVSAHDFVNVGYVELDANTYNFSGSYTNTGTSTTDTSTINFVATSTSETVTSTESPLNFHTLSFGAGPLASSTYTLSVPLDLSGDLTYASGTVDFGGNDVSLEGSISVGANVTLTNVATTTFDGAGAKTWSDQSASGTNIGNVVIDGASTFVTVQNDVRAYDIVIGTNDTLSAGATNFIYVQGDWNNSGSFIAGNGTVVVEPDDRTYPPVIPGSPDWYGDSDFSSRIEIIVQDGELSGDVSNFPTFVDLSTLGADFWSGVQADGRDIRITNGDGQTELAHELVEIDSGAQTGELHFRADTISSSATTSFFIYFNNASATAYAAADTYGRNAVWTDYEAVYHFSDDVSNLGNIVTDSSGNGRELIVLGEALATTTGIVGTALNSSGTVGYLQDSDYSWLSGDRLTSSGWYFMDTFDNETVWEWGTGNNPNDIEFRPWFNATGGLFYFGRNDGTAQYTIVPRTPSIWRHFLTVGATSTSENNVVFEDAVQVDSFAQNTASPSNSDGLRVAGNAGSGLNGYIDELRFSQIERDADWAEAEYNNQFTPTDFYATSSVQNYVPDTTVDEATHNITSGGSAFYNLTFDDATTAPAFIDPSVTVTRNFTIATGTVALPTGTLTIGGSFLNFGFFMNNNGEIEFNGSGGSNVITLSGTEFLNVLYDVTFDGSGAWTFTDSNATATNDFIIEDGTVTMPSGVLAVGGQFANNGGSFANNGGTLSLYSTEGELITTNGSALNNVIFGGSNNAEGWYNSEWGYRTAITVASTSLTGALTEFPVYVDLADLGGTFWSNVQSDGADLRVTTANGLTEVALDVVSIDTTAQTGEVHFLAPSLSSGADTTFYVYHGNSAAIAPTADSTYGSQNVWVHYEAVYHFEDDPTIGVADETANGYDLSPQLTSLATTTGQVGQAVDFDSISGYLLAPGFTWTAGDRLMTSGWYFMDAADPGDDAIWQWGTNDNPNDFRFRPWDSGDSSTRGLFFFGRDDGTADYSISPRVGSVWRHFVTLGATSTSEFNIVYEDATLVGIWQQTDANPSQVDPLQLGREGTGGYIDAALDEFRVSTTTLSKTFIDAEYANQSNASTFYDSSVSETFLSVVPSFTLNEAVTDVDGDVTIQYSALVAPNTDFQIGGSALNIEGSYDPNNATTTFDSTDLGESFDFGDVSFFNLAFDGVGGGWTVSTTTVLQNLTLANGDSYVQSPDTTMTVGGIFSNQYANASTTWADTTLILTGGDYTVTDRLDEGDDYAVLEVSGDTDIIIWNSSISTSTIGDTSSIYMPDHGGVDGELRIFGDYTRTSGAEHWSYTTDFDGTDISGTPRQANVLIDNASLVSISDGATLNIIGDTISSTSVNSIFGAYALSLSNANLNASDFNLAGANSAGLSLASSTNVLQLTNADFVVEAGRSAITVDDTTMGVQPSTQYSGINFASTSATTFYDANWSNQLILTIPASSVPSTLTDFPVYVDLSTLGSEFWSTVKTDGGDIRVTLPDSTEVPIDMVEIDVSDQTGELHFLASSLSPITDNTYYIHFGNPSATEYANDATFGAFNVWGAYEAVYHFHEDPTTIGNMITDMTGRGNDLFVTNAALATTTGQLGTAVDFDSLTGYLLAPAFNWELGDVFAFTGFYNMDAADNAPLFRWGTNANPNTIYFEPWETNNGSTRGNIQFGDSETYIISPRVASVWHHVAISGPTTTGESILLYEDTVEYENGVQATANPSNNDGFRMGAAGTTGTFDGRADEVRIATTTLSEDRFTTEYENHTSASTFYSTTSPSELTTAFNVSVEGVPTTYWQFIGGSGTIYGEDYDNDDGDPGSIQWDNSNFTITIAGTVYADDGVTPIGAPVCNGATEVVTVVLDSTDTYQTACDPLTSQYSIEDIVFAGEPKITAYLDSNALSPTTTIELMGATTASGTVVDTTATVTRPAVVDNSVLVAVIGRDDNGGATISAPAGWTTIDTIDTGTGNDWEAGIWYRVVPDASTEPLDYGFTINDNTEGYSAWVGSLLNVDTTNVLDVTNTWTEYVNLVETVATDVTTVTNNALALAVWYSENGDATNPAATNTDFVYDSIANVDGGSLSVVGRTQETAGSVGDVSAFTISGAESSAIQVGFRALSAPTASSSVTAAVVSQTPLGSASPYETIELREDFVGVGTVAAGADIDVIMPQAENGDLAIVVITRDDGVGGEDISTPAGWTLYDDRLNNAGSDMYLGIWYRQITNAASEPTSYAFTSNDTSAEGYAYWSATFSGTDEVSPFDTSDTIDLFSNDDTPLAESITTATDGARVLAIWAVDAEANITMPGGGWNTVLEDVFANSQILNIAEQTFATAGATGDVELSAADAGDETLSIQLALRPQVVSVTDTLSNFDLYQDRVIVRHEDITPLTIADMDRFDNGDDADIPFTAATTSTDTLTVLPGAGLFVWEENTFEPNGIINLQGGGNTAADGSFRIGQNATHTASNTLAMTVGGSFYVNSGGTYEGASSTVTFSATNTGQQIGADASSTVTFADMLFTGVGGGWAIQTPVISVADVEVATGTVSGNSDLTVNYGSLFGDGLVVMSDGTVQLDRTNTLGGPNEWTFHNLNLGDGSTAGITTRATNATTTVLDTLTINTGHFLNAQGSIWNLTGGGTVFVENGTFQFGTSTVRYAGNASVPQVTHYNLRAEADTGNIVVTAPTTGLSIINDLVVGQTGTATLDINTFDPTVSVGGTLTIAPLGTVEASNNSTLQVFGAWDNDGVFNANSGLVTFNSAATTTVAAGDSDFYQASIIGTGQHQFIESATSTDDFAITSTGRFLMASGTQLSVGGEFTNNRGGADIIWTNSTLYLYGGTAYEVSNKSVFDDYATVTVATLTHPRFWGSSFGNVNTAATGSVYSRNHNASSGELFIFGDYVNNSYDDFWSYDVDFDGVDIADRRVFVTTEDNGSVFYNGGSLEVLGSSTATTSVESSGSGPYSFTVTGTASSSFSYYQFRELDDDGLVFTGTPTVEDLSFGDFLVTQNSASAITVGGTVIDANPAQNYSRTRFASTTGIDAFNVTATGSSVSAWLFDAHYGGLDGENEDNDDGGDPGFIRWNDSTPIFSISGNVYESDGTTVSSVCDDGASTNIFLAVDGSIAQNASSTCSSADGSYSITDVTLNFGDTMTVFINNETDNGVTVSVDPVSSIIDMDIYEDHVIVRHEAGDPISIDDISEFDSGDDAADIPFTAVDGAPDTFTVDPDIKLIVWTNKEFAPGGDITTGGGAGDTFDGEIELQDDASLTLATGEAHSFGGDLLMGTDSVFTPGESTVSFTSAGTGRTIDTNESGFYNLTMSGTGDFVFTDTQLLVGNDLSFTNASATLPAATTTISGSLTTTGGNWNANGGVIAFNSSSAGETITTFGSDFNEVVFTGTGSWSMNDANATTTTSFTIQSGSVTLPSGVLAVGTEFANAGGSFTNNNGEVKLIAAAGAHGLTGGGSTFGDVRVAGAADFTMTDLNAALSGSLTIDAGTLVLASGTLSIGGSLDATGGSFDNATGTILFNSSDTGETINPGTSEFYNVTFGGLNGGWTIESNATATNNFALTSANTFVVNPDTLVHVDGVFTNSVGGANTTWTDSILRLDSGTDYSINTKSAGGDVYGTLIIGENMDLRSWDSSAATTTLASTSNSSLYSQDHSGTPGTAYIYGTFVVSTTTEYWSYATDFDGAALGGSSRAANIFLVSAASSSVTFAETSTLNMVGIATASTTVQAVGAGQYSFDVTGGTFNATYYTLRDMDSNGLEFSGTPTISSLDFGDYELALNSASLITLASTTLDNNASLTITDNRFATGGFTGGINVNLDATTTNSWTYTAHYGGLDGEDFDVDGSDACSSIRWDDSECLLTEQTSYRWRNDDGGEGAPDSEWFDTDWDNRKRVRVVNNDDATYSNVAVKVDVDFENMETDFADLRFTDSDGTTIVSHWIERFTPGVEADVWVQVPELATSSVSEIFMYYNNSSASSTSSSTEVFSFAEDFEDTILLDDYGGADIYTIDGTFAFGGSNGLDATGNEGTRSDFGISTFDYTSEQGQILRYMQYVDASQPDEACTLFGVQSDGLNYAVCLEQFGGAERISLAQDVESTDYYSASAPAVTVLGTTNYTYVTGWYEVEIDWGTDDDIFVSLFDSTGTLVATTSANDNTYTSGGIGFTSWGQNGGWDSFVGWPRTETKPTVYVGLEQSDGGASWKAAQDTPTGGYLIGETARLHIAIENSGLDIENQNFRLESALKGVAPSCEAVSSGSFSAVPTAASCSGSDEICMTTSASVTDGDATTDHLLVSGGTFVAGEIVANNNNETGNIDVNQNQYTELEYAINLTASAVNDAYCFRVTSSGAALDSYALLPELTLAFDPTISTASLNNGENIITGIGATTTIFATATVSDLNGFTDLQSATATIYRSGEGEDCTEDDNNCYRATTTNQCQFINCAGNECTLSCTADIAFHADPTDSGTFAGETWRAFFEVSDTSGASSTAQAPSVDLQTMRALEVINDIGYGTVGPESDTENFNPTTTINNLGNEAFDIDVSGTDMSDGGVSIIPAGEQLFSTSTFTYSSCVTCSALTNIGSTIEVDLPKPTVSSPLLSDDIYWGINIPFGTAGAPHDGTNTFTAVPD